MKRPQNCGTGYCSCIECVMEPAQQEPVAWMIYTKDGQSVYVTDNPTDIQEGQRALPLYAMAQPTVPDALTIADKESADYHEGWNDCRALMLEMRKP